MKLKEGGEEWQKQRLRWCPCATQECYRLAVCCTRCGYMRRMNLYPPMTNVCNTCGGKDHFAKCTDSETIRLMKIENGFLCCKLDTRLSCSVIPERPLALITTKKEKKCSTMVPPFFSGRKDKDCAKVSSEVWSGKSSAWEELFVIWQDAPVILGGNLYERLGLIRHFSVVSNSQGDMAMALTQWRHIQMFLEARQGKESYVSHEVDTWDWGHCCSSACCPTGKNQERTQKVWKNRMLWPKRKAQPIGQIPWL